MEEKLCPSCEEPVIDKQPPCPLSCMSPKCKAYQKEIVINVSQKPIIWVLGGPGCGKGTQCKKMVAKYGYTHVSAGDVLRAEAVSGSDRSKCLANVMTRGGLVPTDIIINVIKDEMMKNLDTAKGYIVDGYPREKDQGLAFEQNIAIPTAIMYFEASPETLLKRLKSQAAQDSRIDDNEDTIKARIQTFLVHNKEVLKQYMTKHYVALHTISAEGNADTVFNEVQRILTPIVEKAQAAVAKAAVAAKKSQV